MTKNIKKQLLIRLFIVWLILTPLMASLVAYLELERVDQQVLNLVLSEVSTLEQEVINQMAINPVDVIPHLQAFAHKLVKQHFVVVDIYDENRSHLAEVMRNESRAVQTELGKKHHNFPLDEKIYHEKLRFNGELYIQVLLPLYAESTALAGYFEGVYLVREETLTSIEAQVVQMVLFVVIIVSITTATVYPIILYLNRKLIKFSRDVFQANVELMKVLGTSISKRDATTDAHNYRVSLYAVSMGKLLKFDDLQMKNLIAGAFLHDVGKLGVADAILRKAGKLTELETIQMHEHVSIGMDIIKSVQWLHGADDIVKYHHEHYDGTGYMTGLKGDDIPINARIFAIIDVFDALMSERPYKKPFELNEAIALLEAESNTHFDPQLLILFIGQAPKLYANIGHANYAELTHQLSQEIRKYFFSPAIDDEHTV